MKILAVSGSPRKNGNTETLLASFLKGAEEAGAETRVVRLAEIPFKNCKGCNACHKKGIC
ncbi:MAG TPA: flavodoxin family protein, partial [Methanocorpusculum sp.]|nr:flavodoxin family protein [Methanocorpusculum sp.]